ncbi:hypothetical protein HYN48_13340 [Flavobacterium magnum]|uniref:Uncharacterized protein n=1 Tax=Flavobacterium magnum TaxID=2162713 RepID=A0A2S0RH43_9FLAO|nr:hypothetical protein [Flavobacterium magnum]AWA30984.1 hypothetical protein HYN48_13340 [Flavobacterium magnum]
MKKAILFFLTLGNCILYSQYSGYYNINTNSNIDVNANINHNISGNVYEYKTITTIDYGALQLANAQNEKNRLELQRFQDEREKEIALQIAADPLKAYDYGSWFTISSKDKIWKEDKNSKENLKKIRENTGFKEFNIEYVIPNPLIFTMLSAHKFQNVSPDGVKADIYIYLPVYNKNNVEFDFEKDFENVVVGSEVEQVDDQNKLRKIFFHKKELNRATIYGINGYRSTYIWEDKLEDGITNNYQYTVEKLGNGYQLLVKVRYYGNKSEVDFEKLEGRRYYLKPLVEKIIATAKVSDLEILKK